MDRHRFWSASSGSGIGNEPPDTDLDGQNLDVLHGDIGIIILQFLSENFSLLFI
jgi:hypothetical protein